MASRPDVRQLVYAPGERGLVAIVVRAFLLTLVIVPASWVLAHYVGRYFVGT